MLSQHRTESLATNHYRQLFTAPMPTVLHVSYIPNGKVEDVDPQTFAKNRGMIAWTETVLVDKPLSGDFSNEQFVGLILNETDMASIVRTTAYTAQHFVIANMNEKMGYGVYTTAAIKQRDAVAIYAGIEISNQDIQESDIQSEYTFDIEDNHDKSVGIIDAKNYGNACRFIHHAPSKATHVSYPENPVNQYEFHDSAMSSQVATANLISMPYRYKNHTITVMHAMRDIKAGEWLGYDYGGYWWNTRRHPLLVNVKGKVIPDTEYKITHWLVNIATINNHFVGACIDFNQVQRYQKMPLTTQFDFEQCAGTAVVSPDDFVRAWKSTPATSPYIFLDKPPHIIYTRQEPLGTAKQPVNNQAVVKLKGGFFLSQGEHIQNELLRIFNSFQGLSCQFYKEKNTAVIMHHDADIINAVKQYLLTSGLTIKSGKNQITKVPMLYVINPTLSILRDMSTYQPVCDTSLKPSV